MGVVVLSAKTNHNKPPIAPIRFWRKHGKKIIYAILAYLFVKWAISNTFIGKVDPMMFVQIGLALVMQIAQVVMYFGFFFYWLGGRIRCTTYLPGDLSYTWDDFVGSDAIKERAKLIVEGLTNKAPAAVLGGVRTTHMMFVGAPGTGKTYMAQIIAAEAGVPVMIVEASSLLGTFIGIGPLKVINLFKKLNKLSRIWSGAVMFIDEIDTIAMSRGGTGGTFGLLTGNVSGQILNVMLACISGINEPSGIKHRIRKFLKDALGIPYRWVPPNVIIVGSTNRPLEMLDQAFLRPGRLEEHLEFPLPKFTDLCKLIKYYLEIRVYDLGSGYGKVMAGVPHDESCEIEAMAWLAAGSSQAGIESAMNKAKRLAAAQEVDKITLDHWMQAVVEARMGLKQPLDLTGRDVKMLSWHEAGHGIAALIWGEEKKLPIATIDRYGSGALGHVMPIAVEQHILVTGYDLETQYMISLSSLVAEEMVGSRTPGTARDLDTIKHLTILMLSQGILGSPWMVKPPKETGGRTVGAGLPISELTDDGQKLADAYFHYRKKEARQGLEENREALEAFVTLLAEKRTVNHEEIMRAVGALLKPLELSKFKWETHES